MIGLVPLLLIGLGSATPEVTRICMTDVCSCLELPEARVALASAEAVFLGTVTGIDEIVSARAGEALPGREVTLRIHAAWKGVDEASASVVVRTGHGAGDCGFDFERGTAYLVYAHDSGEGLSTSICTRTIAARSAQSDFEVLGHPPFVRLR
ncbi:hypothetical protein BH23GEM6_BH23GEM6_19490 [soil metagenome]